MPRMFADEFSRLTRAVRQLQQDNAQSILIGKCKSFDEYKYYVGYGDALVKVLEDMKRITGSEGEE